jgi:C2H2 transcription facotor
MQFPSQAPFFYYNPDPSPENRQHGHFTPHPHGLPMPVPGQEAMPIYAQNMYQRPSSSCSQVPYPPMPHQYAPHMMTPVQSPQPVYQKPTILVQQDSPYLIPLDTDCYAPSTPPLSSSGSAISSPPCSAELLPTPVNGGFAAHVFDGIKVGCEEEVFSEILAGEDWSRTASPPMTPGT